jgi:hypothetical protein
MKIRFQADADSNQNIVRAVLRRQPLIDFRAADEGSLRGLSDLDVLAATTCEGRALVSHDRQTMPGHFTEFLRTQHRPGVFVLSQSLLIGLAAEELVMVWEASDAAEWIDIFQALRSDALKVSAKLNKRRN